MFKGHIDTHTCILANIHTHMHPCTHTHIYNISKMFVISSTHNEICRMVIVGLLLKALLEVSFIQTLLTYIVEQIGLGRVFSQ